MSDLIARLRTSALLSVSELHAIAWEAADALEASSDEYKTKLTTIVSWLEVNQPDVFRRGLWDALYAAASNAVVPGVLTAMGISDDPQFPSIKGGR